MDMAGFAINLQVLLDIPEAKFDLRVQRGYQETSLLKKIVTMEELEPKANNCTEVSENRCQDKTKIRALGLSIMLALVI